MRPIAVPYRKHRKTFAPPSPHQDAREIIRPSRGSVVEVLVAWHERIIAIHHFPRAKAVTVGADSGNDIVLPSLGTRRLPILQIDQQGAKILAHPQIRIDFTRDHDGEKFAWPGSTLTTSLPLQQGELARLELTSTLAILVRYVPHSRQATAATSFGLSAGETTGTVLALALLSTLRLYMALYQAPRPPLPVTDDPVRLATISFARPTPEPTPASAPAARHTKGGAGARARLFALLASDGTRENLSEVAGLAKPLPGPQVPSGPKLKETGARGNPRAVDGIGGDVTTRGRASGQSSYGQTSGLGGHTSVSIAPGGNGEIISGKVDRAAIRRVIVENLKTIRACYERQLNRQPDLYGKIILAWEIGEHGRVLSARAVANELDSPEVAECLLSHLRSWRFPEPPGQQVVEVEAFPFLFSN